ncbi:hypothetical protein MBLNU459_g2660t3 [Dothideomycetes sp. NU459]
MSCLAVHFCLIDVDVISPGDVTDLALAVLLHTPLAGSSSSSSSSSSSAEQQSQQPQQSQQLPAQGNARTAQLHHFRRDPRPVHLPRSRRHYRACEIYPAPHPPPAASIPVSLVPSSLPLPPSLSFLHCLSPHSHLPAASLTPDTPITLPMASQPHTPSNGLYGSVPPPNDAHLSHGYGSADASQTNVAGTAPTGVSDFARDHPAGASPLAQSYSQGAAALPSDDYADAQRDISASAADGLAGRNRATSDASTAVFRDGALPSRGGTLKKKASVSRKSSLKRSGSRKSLAAGSIKGVGFANTLDGGDYNSALFTPIPTTGSPTEILADRFQAWRTLLKTLITYFREVQSSYDHRSKAIMKVSNVLSNMSHPSVFITDGGLADASRVLSDYHKHSLTEANKSKDIEADVIAALSGLRSDLSQKIKEIKSLSGDFKNSVDKEKETTKRAIAGYADALQHANHGEAGKTDPFLAKLGVDRAVERQVDEENYLHRAYLNLESSGRELESIVVGEIQKAYNALAGILKREGDDAYNTVEQLRTGPIAMPKDLEWNKFVESDPHFVNPKLPLRRIEDIDYPGKDNYAASEVRAGMLERKSKYLKSYTPGWYVLSPTYLHEFKSADKIYSQPPVMSLYLPDQKLGSHSAPGSSSHKFMLKGKQSGGMHRGHSWVFRAESYDTMIAWFEAIKALTEKTGEDRNAFVRAHARSVSGNSHRRTSISSDGDALEEDEADQVPYSAASSVANQPVVEQTRLQRPLPGGRFPSDINIQRSINAPLSPSSESPSEPDHDTIAAATAMPGTTFPAEQDNQHETDPYRLDGIAAGAVAGAGTGAVAADIGDRAQKEAIAKAADPNTVTEGYAQPAREQYDLNPVDRFDPTHDQHQPTATQTFALPLQSEAPVSQVQPEPVSPLAQPSNFSPAQPSRQHTNYGEWMAPAAAGVGAGVIGSEAYRHHNAQKPTLAEDTEPTGDRNVNPTTGSPVPVMTTTNTIPHSSSMHLPVTEPIPTPSEGYGRSLSSAEAVPTPAAEMLPTSNTGATHAGAFQDNSGISGAVSSNPSTVEYGINGLGGLERQGAHETGVLFPKVIRHDTDMSVSQLHVPGEFPVQSGRVQPSTTTTGDFVPPSTWSTATK